MKNLIWILLFFTSYCYSHDHHPKLDSARAAIEKNKFDKAEELLKSMDTTQLLSKELATYFTIIADSYYHRDEHDKAYSNYLKAKALYLVNEDERMVIEMNRYLSTTATYLKVDNKYVNGFIEEICQYASKVDDAELKCDCLYRKLSRLKDVSNPVQNKKALEYLWKYKNIAVQNDLKDQVEIAIFNLGAIHMEAKNKDSSFFYFEKSMKSAKMTDDLNTISYLNNNYAILYRNLEEFDKSIEYHLKTIESDLSVEDLSTKLFYLKNLAKTYSLKGDNENATITYEKVISLSDSLNRNEQTIAANELEIKYQTAEKEKQLLISENESQQRLSTIYLLSGAALSLFLLGGLVYNNQRKKKLIAQKEQIIEKSRADAILKNQELATIDAMISGQEKERKRLAEELHDDLGSTLTTVRLYFENLKSQFTEDNSQEVFNRTENLLDEAYEKIRNMSHTRNSGVLASKGLIPTLESLAQKITESGKIKVEIIHHGLDQSLENSLELTIFRIIQELMSNVIKHAQAHNAVVSLTAYENSINIMVEDDGIGFNKSQIANDNGIGLHNIEKRIENLDGTMEIDSNENHGTTINLDIPLV
ncbi:MAG: ATP-binding protein [Nonlabens sp.]|uniref:tetratricopeptide repeat-containing sensor histidine kinase n=1 Tax=Nonlabens sp. TaxID=1888209 RepID=UPI003EF77DF2